MTKPTTSPATNAGPVRYAVVGLGFISQSAMLPAFAHATRNSKLVALVSGDAEKLKTLGRRYGKPRLVRYEQYDELLASGEIDAVYIALPNTMHHDFTIHAAGHGVHVLCEKPLATTAQECLAMVQACRNAEVRLMTAYRLHFEPATLTAIESARTKIGDRRLFTSTFSNTVAEGNIRLNPRLGGGTLFDIGIYCINAARHLFEAEPERVVATTMHGNDPRFREVEELASCVLHFPGDRMASFTCTFNGEDESAFDIIGTRGRVRLDMAYEIAEQKMLTLVRGGKKRVRTFAKCDQFAAELLHFSDCILEGRDPIPSGDEGMRDLLVIEALYESAKRGRPVAMERAFAPPAFTRKQAIRRPPVHRVPMFHAAPPAGD